MGSCPTWRKEACAPYSVGASGGRDGLRIVSFARTILWLCETAREGPDPLPGCLFAAGLVRRINVPASAELPGLAYLCRTLTYHFLSSNLARGRSKGVAEKSSHIRRVGRPGFGPRWRFS